MDRKSMLIQAEAQVPQMPKDVKKLEEDESEGIALKIMTETRGWRILLEKFMKPRYSLKRFLQSSTTQTRHEVWGALQELDDLMSFIDRHIKDGQSAQEQLKSMRK